MRVQGPGPESADDSQPPPGDRPDNPISGHALFERLYAELHALAQRQFSHERPGLTLQPTALVHEAYLRLLAGGQTWDNERYFFAAAAEAMRRILVERARRVSREKHGGGRRRQALDDAEPATIDADPEPFLALHGALDELRAHDESLAEVVMLRYFAGMTVEGVARVLGRSERAVKYDWAAARAWLIRRMGETGDAPPPR